MNTDDLNFAYKVRHALNETLDHLPPATTDRLASARQLALARKKAHAAAPSVGMLARWRARFAAQPASWVGRMGVAVPLLALAAGMVGVYQYEQEQRIADLAEVDAAVLSDELPLSAYLDHGFNAYLTTKREQ
ncbi:MAG: DUF3619 family protein [Pseudomonadota bacterium]